MVMPYFVGVVTAPLVGMIIKPLLRGTVKTTIGVALQVKKLAAEVSEDFQDLAAEASSEIAVQSAAGAQTAADTAVKAAQSRAATTAETVQARAAAGPAGAGGGARRGTTT